MRVIQTFVPNDQIASSFLNQLQQEIANAIKADSNNDLTSLAAGFDGRIWQDKAGIANAAAPVKIDSSIDWRDRILWGFYFDLTAAANGLGGANEYNFSSQAPTLFQGYTGTGGLDAGGADPTATNPPVLGAGKYLVNLDTGVNTMLMYANVTTGGLYVYNNSGGATRYPVIVVLGSGDAGFH